jgi:hypothetical protein
MATKQKTFKQAYVVTVDMGYGHQRAVYPLKDIAASPDSWQDATIVTANNYAGIPQSDRLRWEGSRKLYETVSRLKKIPLIGPLSFSIMDYLQRIEPFYPKRDLSRPTLQLKEMYRMIRQGWGKHLIDVLNLEPLPLFTSFFAVAFFAEEHGYQGDIYCLCTDTDISRAWAPFSPKQSRIKYCAPNKRVKQRLEQYGVPAQNIFVTGFPLPIENTGPKNLQVLRRALAHRIRNLDPQLRYQRKYKTTIEAHLGAEYGAVTRTHPLTITFAVGGAGAQRDIGITILESLHEHIDAGHVRLNLVAGSRNDVYSYYDDKVKELHLDAHHSGMVNIIYAADKMEYFKKFNEALLTTDVLWTKPSELSFYAALGLPIIIAPSIGSQEDYNRAWLHAIGAGFEQEDPRYTHQWLFDWLDSGWLAEAAMSGFLHAPRHGTYHVQDVILRGKRSEIEDVQLL